MTAFEHLMGALGDYPCSAATAAQCTNPPTTQITVGCVHEHIEPAHVCDGHLQAIIAGRAACYRCFHSDFSHLCQLFGRVMA
jgi:hypothetical protein